MTTAVRHETRALLRAHLSAATGYRHLTRHCPVCHRLLRLAMEPHTARSGPPAAASAPTPPSDVSEPPHGRGRKSRDPVTRAAYPTRCAVAGYWAWRGKFSTAADVSSSSAA